MSFWPSPYSAAISLTFDDGMESHLKIAIPEMDKRNFQGTFYLNPRGADDPASPEFWLKKLERWSRAAGRGHEMGNHTIGHPCSLNINVEWSVKNLLDMTLDEIAVNIDEAQVRLMTAFPHQKHTSFAYPCYESTVGKGANRTSYVPLVAQRFVAARARGWKVLFCATKRLSFKPAEEVK